MKLCVGHRLVGKPVMAARFAEHQVEGAIVQPGNPVADIADAFAGEVELCVV